MKTPTTRPTLREIRAAARDALDRANHYGHAADDVLAHPGDLGALRTAREIRAAAVDAIADAHHVLDCDGADDDRALAGALRNLRAAADVLGACDAALGLGSAAEMAVAS
jgi:hypothetical protein